MIAAIGTVLIAFGVLSRLFSLSVYRRISESPSRSVAPSFLPSTPWLRVQSDRAAVRLIVVGTYVAVMLGMALVLVGVLA